MALLVAVIAGLVLAVLVVLGVFAWVLLAPLIRQRRQAKESEREDEEPGATVLFGKPVMRPLRRQEGMPAPRPPAPVVARSSEPEPPAAAEEAAAARATAELPAPPAPAPPPPDEPPIPAKAAPLVATPLVAPPPVADVLVVTADSALSDCQLAILAARGCASRRATTASDAVGQLRTRIPDLMLVDAGAASEGVPLVAALRAWRATESLPVVLFTANADADVSRSAAELRVTDVVVDAPSVPGLVERALPYWLAGVGVFSSTAG